jgi:hypothetical protein
MVGVHAMLSETFIDFVYCKQSKFHNVYINKFYELDCEADLYTYYWK